MRWLLPKGWAAKLMFAAVAFGLLIAAAASFYRPVVAETVDSERHRFKIVTLAEDLEHPWGMAFLPDGSLLVTERPGRLRIIRSGEAPLTVSGVPEVVEAGQGGMLDVALHPDFAENRLVYLSYAGAGDGGVGTEVARGRLEGDRLVGLETIFVAQPKSRGGRHFGSRLLFDDDGLLYVTLGERGDSERAQNLNDHGGKVIRLTPDGKIPADNPFVGRDDARPEVFSWGHRNPQGLALQPGTGRVWAVEHGPRGGDELNIIEPGANYGWPIITYGRSYAGFSIGEGTRKPGLSQPVTYWVPSISPSGLSFYNGDAFPQWRGNLFTGGLSAQALTRIELQGTEVVHQERLLVDYGERIRDVRQGPEGFLYLLIDQEDGALLRLEPVS
jgi:glucose/arabinose dehydrogenase